MAARRVGLSAAWLALALAAGPAAGFAGRVVHVVDGDTIHVATAGRAPLVVRLQGIDAPERCQSGGEAARSALAARLLQRRVELRVRAHDAYGRAIGRVWLDGEDVNAWLVAQGHAWSPGWHHRSGPYAREEQQARAARRGVFAEDHPIEPWRFRTRHGPCH